MLRLHHRYSKQHNLNCITLEGDQVNHRGAITGGYHDPSRSRIEAMKGVVSSVNAEKALQKALAEGKAREAELDSSVAEQLGAMQRIEADKRMKKGQHGQTKMEVEAEQDAITSTERTLARPNQTASRPLRRPLLTPSAKSLVTRLRRLAELRAA